MALTDITFDGTPEWGSQLISIDGEQYVAESFDVTFGTETNHLLDEYGTERAAVIISKQPNGSMTLQVDQAQALPSRGNEFSVTIDGTVHNFYLSECSVSQSQNDFQKLSCSFTTKIN